MEHIAAEGTLDVGSDGELLFTRKGTSVQYIVAQTFSAYADVFAVVRMRDPACPDASLLATFSEQLRSNGVSPIELQAVRECVAAIRVFAAKSEPLMVSDAAESVVIRYHLDAADAKTV